jgi:hypothetical protein
MDLSRIYTEGMIAGILGAATVAIWFLLVDLAAGRAFYTPTVLGTALFRHGAGLPLSEVPPDAEMVLMFTWVHGLVFAALGGLVSHLLAVAERHPGLGFGILLLFVIFEAGFGAAAFLVAEPVLQALAWPAVLVANLLAATAMILYFRRRHPFLRVEP